MDALSNPSMQKAGMGTQVALQTLGPILSGAESKRAYGSQVQTELEKGRALSLNYLQRQNEHRRQALFVLRNIRETRSSQLANLSSRHIDSSSGSARAVMFRNMNLASRDFSTSINNLRVSKSNAALALLDAQRRADDLRRAGTSASKRGLMSGAGALAGGLMDLQQSGFFDTPPFQPLYNFTASTDPYTSAHRGGLR